MKKIICLTGVIFAGFLTCTAYAYQENSPSKILIISDIDDTLKMSHVLNPVRAATRVPNFSLRFTGMSQLYQLLALQKNKETRFMYLSNAPLKIAGVGAMHMAHKMFLSYNNFPQGILSLKDDFFNKNHKINEIRKLIQAENPDSVIFIGDNGERDVEIYHQAELEYQKSNIQFVTFIHQVYKTKKRFFDGPFYPEVGKSLLPEQIGFVTPVEISLELNKRGLLDLSSTNWMIHNVATYIANESYFNLDAVGNSTFPSFKKCSDFSWIWPVSTEIAPLLNKIRSACKN